MGINFQNYIKESVDLSENVLNDLLPLAKDNRCAIITPFENVENKNITYGDITKLISALSTLGYTAKKYTIRYYSKEDNKVIKKFFVFIQNTDKKITEFDRDVSLLSKRFKQNYVLIIPQGQRNAYLLDVDKNKGQKQKIKNYPFLTDTIIEAYKLVDGKDYSIKQLTESLDCEFKDEKLKSYIGKQVIKEMQE